MRDDYIMSHAYYHTTPDLFVDVGLVHKRVKNIDHAMNVPHTRGVFQLLYLFGRTTLELSPELDKILKLYFKK